MAASGLVVIAVASAAALVFESPGLLSHPAHHFVALRLMIGLSMFAGLAGTSVLLFVGHYFDAGVGFAGIAAFGLIGGEVVLASYARQSQLTKQQRRATKKRAEPLLRQAGKWIALLGLFVGAAMVAVAQIRG